MGDTCAGCGFSKDTVYWVGNEPRFCQRCEALLSALAQRWRRCVTDERMATHLVFSTDYAARFAHGAPGHLDYMTIAALAAILDDPARVLP